MPEHCQHPAQATVTPDCPSAARYVLTSTLNPSQLPGCGTPVNQAAVCGAHLGAAIDAAYRQPIIGAVAVTPNAPRETTADAIPRP